MTTRKIKDAVDLTANEVIYFKGHAQATYMTDGTTVEDAVNSKVSKVEGKQLSTEDFTTPLKDKLDNLHNYDDSALVFEVEELRREVDALESGSTETLAKVAKTGDYNDLNNKPTIPAEQVNADWNATSGKAQILNKPTIPTEVTESMVSGWGFTKNEGTYSKPSDGIPKTDLASDVQSSLDKADTALQSYTEQYKGTVTGININGTTEYPNPSGIVYLEDIGGGNTGYPITRERTDFLSPNMVYNLYVEPNTYHILTKSQEFAHEIKINLNSYDPFNTEEYVIELVGFEDIDTITMPSGVDWADAKSPSIIEGATIIMSIVNGKGVWAKF